MSYINKQLNATLYSYDFVTPEADTVTDYPGHLQTLFTHTEINLQARVLVIPTQIIQPYWRLNPGPWWKLLRDSAHRGRISL